MLNDIRFALRLLLKSPGFTLTAILALALGIGANTALFSVVDSVFLRPLPYPEPDRLVRLSSTDPDIDLTRVGFSWPRYLAVRDSQQVFSDLAVGAFNGFTVTGRGDPELVQGFHASANYFDVLGVQPHLGRGFNATEDAKGGPDVVLISHEWWRQRFNSDPAILGRPLTVSGRPHTIIGVLPPALSAFPLNQIHLWLPRPIGVGYLVPAQIDNGAFAFQVIARLKPGVSLDQARRNVEVLAAAYRQASPRNVDANSRAEVFPLLDDIVGQHRRTYGLLFAAVGCVLLIACAGGALGLLLAGWGVSAILAVGGDLIPRAFEIAVEPRALLFALLVALATGLGMGLLPALQASTSDVNDALKDSSRGSSGGSAGRLRGALLVGEIALSLVLLISAGLLLTSFSRLQRVSAGFSPGGVLVAGLNLPFSKYVPRQTLEPFYRQLHEKLSVLPGVRSAAVTDRVPLTGNATPAPVAVSGRPIPPMSQRATANRHLVSSGFFATLGIPFKAGRDFDERDNPQSPHVVIINETFARKHFQGENPLGRTLITGMSQMPSEVVGVVADIRATNLHTPPQPDYYLPALQRPENFTSILLRTEADPAAFVSTLRAALKEIDPDLPLLDPQPLPHLVARTFADRRLAMLLLGGFAGLALLLAGVGVYSVIAYVVGQRAAEIGIRMALGASPRDVLGLVLGQGLRLALLGIVIGVGAALALTRLMQNVLFEVEAHDPLIHGGLALFILLVAAFACWLPARRATRIDPLLALRSE